MYNRMLVTVCIHVTVYMYVLCHTLFLEPTEHMGNASNIERRDNLPNKWANTVTSTDFHFDFIGMIAGDSPVFANFH